MDSFVLECISWRKFVMNNRDIENLEHRISELERLVWSLFRTLETFVTLNELFSAPEESRKNDRT